MFIKNWDDFKHSVAKLQETTDPNRIRFNFKYEHKKGKLIITVTDDNVRLQFKTDQQQDVKRLEKMLAENMQEITGRGN